MTRSPSPSSARTLDIELSGQEIISVELDSLDPDASDLIEVLRDAQSPPWIWTKLAAEYWRQGHLESAEKLAHTGIETLEASSQEHNLSPIHSLIANMQISRAQKAPKLILQDARYDDQKSEKTRKEYYLDAAQHINKVNVAQGGGVSPTLGFLTRAILQMGNQSMDDALRSFEGVLAEKPTNIVALLGKARILFTRRQYPQALKLFQEVLRLKPDCKPDPRIGIGLCLWQMDQKAKAKAAWQRSAEVAAAKGEDSWPAYLLLGLEAINASKNENQPEEQRRNEFLHGTKLVERAFKANQKNSAAANALCELFIRKKQFRSALKLAERTIQYADTLTLLTEGYIRAGRTLHAEGSNSDAMKHYSLAREGQPANVLAAIGLAQMQIINDEIPGAIHALDNLIQKPPGSELLEATAMLASLRAHPRPGVSSSDQAQERSRARELFDRLSRHLGLPEDPHSQLGGSKALTPSTRALAEDSELHLEIARLWQNEDLGRAERAYKEALRLNEAAGRIEPRLLNNLGVIHQLADRSDQARSVYENALTTAAALEAGTGEGMSASILYNLARVYEEQGEEAMAKEAYDKLLTRHPEYVDAKIRQAQILASINRHNDAHELLKQALLSQGNNLNLRAFYTHFLIQSGLLKPAKEFVFATLKDHDRHDIYSLCAAAWIQYHQARESRDTSSDGVKERRRGFQRSAELYEKALHLDPTCAIAAQGLAIVIAEDALGNLSGQLGPPGPDDLQKRLKNVREALDIFAKVRESLDDGSVYANMGHCYFASDDFDRAIESYETASKKFYHGHNVSVLLCLCRAWYAKANKDQSFSAMNTALRYAQTAYHLQPSDKVILYNIAMIQQKAAEMLISLPPAKRTLKDLQKATEQAANAQKLFASLAADQSPVLPYNRDIADQRRKYGDGVLRRCDEHLASQRQYEADMQAKVEAARQKRQADKERQEALERQRLEEIRRREEELKEQRRIQREQAQEWTRGFQAESDEEKERKAKKAQSRRPKAEPIGSGDEANGESRKKRKGKLRKHTENDEEDALFSEEEEAVDKPAKKRQKKRAVREDDEEVTSAPRKKQFKSKEYISDSDEEMS